jgi:hypothetical protein
MLYSIDGKRVTKMVREADYAMWRRRMTDDHYARIEDALNEYAESRDNFVSSHIPGANWNGTPYQPIYDACNHTESGPRFMFGLILWKVMMERADEWVFYRPESDGEDVSGLRYFRKIS